MRGIPAVHLAILGILMAAQVACGVLASVANSDTNRDLFFAQQIASAQAFPLTGPAINATFHVGPLWYYLLALPLLIVPNGATVPAFMALMSATQFPLAYLLGRRLRSAQAGLLFAAGLALPGWVVTSLGSLTHPVIAIPSLLLGVLAAQAYRSAPDWPRAFGLGAGLLLMSCAHPTLVLPGVLLLAVAFWPLRSAVRQAGHFAMIVLLVLLSMLPVMYEQWLSGFADAAAMAVYPKSDWSLPSLWKALELVGAIALHGPRYVTRYWLGLSPEATSWLFALYLAVFALAGIGLAVVLRRDAKVRRLAAVLAAAMLTHAMFLAAIRNQMRPWMIYVEAVPLAALLALGLEWFWRWRTGRFAVATLLSATTLWTFAVYAWLATGPEEVRLMHGPSGKNAFMDVRDYEDTGVRINRIARMRFRELFELGEHLCSPVSLYGHYAYLVDYTYAVSAAHHCGTTRYVQLGGPPSADRAAWMGLQASAWRELGLAPEQWLGSLGIARPAAIWHSPQPFEPVVPTFHNFPRQLAPAGGSFVVEGDADAQQAVLISNRAVRYLPFAVLRATANGREVLPRYEDVLSAAYIAPEHTGATIHWRFEIAANPYFVDVVVFGAMKTAAADRGAATRGTRARGRRPRSRSSRTGSGRAACRPRAPSE